MTWSRFFDAKRPFMPWLLQSGIQQQNCLLFHADPLENQADDENGKTQSSKSGTTNHNVSYRRTILRA
jgi:hypothetical protein